MNILFVNCCMRGQKSRTLKVAKAFLDELQKQDDVVIKELNLAHQRIFPLTPQYLEVRERLLESKMYDDSMFAYAHQFAKADKIIFAAPFWENSFPALMKIYIENVTANGITISYQQKAKPLVMAQKLLYIATAGGAIGGFDFAGEQVRSLCKLWKIKDFNCLYAENLDILETDTERIMDKAICDAVEFAKVW